MTLNLKNDKELRRKAIYLIAALLAVIGIVSGYHYGWLYAERKRLEAEVIAGPHVDVVQATKTPTERQLTLVGEARPFASVTLYAKVSGYLKSVRVDKGDEVKKDQLLAVIESPEIDKEYQGALAEAKNKKSIAGRMAQLRERNLVSPQEADQADSDFAVAQSRLDSLAVQKGYESLRAPFPGTVTSRYADPGALVQNAANSQTSAQPVVTISQVNSLRIYAYVDQRDASYIQTGSPAKITVAERPDLEFAAKVSRVSGELDPKTKMLLTEIDVDNKEGKLVPGSLVKVLLEIHTPENLQLPVQALVIIEGKTMIPIINSDDTIHFREIRPGINDGKMVTVLEGLNEGERVALNVGSNVPDGNHVRPNAKKPEDKAPVPKAAEKG